MQTPDIPESQVLVAMEGAVEGFWHHLLLGRIRDAVWITVDPYLKVVAEDLSNEDVIPLARAPAFPRPGRPFLALDDLSDPQLAALRSAGLCGGAANDCVGEVCAGEATSFVA